MDGQRPSGKPFAIEKMEVWRAWEKVRANKGAPGVDAVTLAEFGEDLKDNLYKVWNRMSSGSYFPPPVMAVEIPKPHGGGTRVLGVPTIADRVAQTVVAARIGAVVEPVFHGDSYGYRPGRSALDAVGVARQRCWAPAGAGARGGAAVAGQRGDQQCGPGRIVTFGMPARRSRARWSTS